MAIGWGIALGYKMFEMFKSKRNKKEVELQKEENVEVFKE